VSLQKLRVVLRAKTEKELIDEIADLYKKFDGVKRYYQASLLNDGESVLKYSQTKIVKAMQPRFTLDTYLPTYKIAEAKKVISEYKKVSSDDYGIAMLMLFYVKECIKVVNEYGYIDKIWSSGISTFELVIKFIVKVDLVSDMREEIEEVIQLPNDCNEMSRSLAHIYKRENGIVIK
jgi:hypothetical protein